MTRGCRIGVAAAVGFFLAAILFLGGPPAWAVTLDELLPELLDTHNQVKAAEEDLSAAHERARVALGGWYPSMNVTGDFGRNAQWKPKASGKAMMMKEADLTLTQRLWDFGATNSAVRSARLSGRCGGLWVLSSKSRALITVCPHSTTFCWLQSSLA